MLSVWLQADTPYCSLWSPCEIPNTWSVLVLSQETPDKRKMFIWPAGKLPGPAALCLAHTSRLLPGSLCSSVESSCYKLEAFPQNQWIKPEGQNTRLFIHTDLSPVLIYISCTGCGGWIV